MKANYHMVKPLQKGKTQLVIKLFIVMAFLFNMTSIGTVLAAESEVALPELSLSKKVDSGAAVSNEQLTYTINWTVGGEADATHVVLTDPIPENTSIVSVHGDGEYDSDSNSAIWDLGTKSPGDTGSVSVVLLTGLNLTGGSIIKNTATMESSEVDPVSADATTTIMDETRPILQITKDVNNEKPTAGDTVTYTVVVTNVGSAAAENVTLSDTLPKGLTFAKGKTTKTFELGDIAIGKSVTQTYKADLAKSANSGTYENIAIVYADNHDSVIANSEIELVPVVLGDTTEPELAVNKSVNVEFANPGDVVEYKIVLTNNGSGDAMNVTVVDRLPLSFLFEETKDVTKEWAFESVAAGETKEIVYKVVIDNEAKSGTYDNLAVVTADELDDLSANSSLEVRETEVLGVLTETGTAFRDYILYFLGISLVASGIWFYTREKRLEQSK
jgi:uncharacterized repeat protein (TIGR01451 family)